MTKEDAWKTIEFNKGFNLEYFPSGLRPEEAAVLLARKKALALAWETIADDKPTPTKSSPDSKDGGRRA